MRLLVAGLPYPRGLYAPHCGISPIPERAVCASLCPLPIPERAVCASLLTVPHTREGSMRLIVTVPHTREGSMRLIAHSSIPERALCASLCIILPYPRGLYAPHCASLPNTRKGSIRLIASLIPERALCASLLPFIPGLYLPGYTSWLFLVYTSLVCLPVYIPPYWFIVEFGRKV